MKTYREYLEHSKDYFKVKNAYQKIKAGDTIHFKSYPSYEKHTVISKHPGGLLKTKSESGSEHHVYASDVLMIHRNGTKVA